MADFSHSIDVSIDKKKYLRATAQGTQSEGKVRIAVLRGSAPTTLEEITSITWLIDWENQTIKPERPSLATGKEIACLAACLAGTVGSFVNCLLNSKSKDAVWKCMEEHAVSGVTDAIKCVLECLD